MELSRAIEKRELLKKEVIAMDKWLFDQKKGVLSEWIEMREAAEMVILNKQDEYIKLNKTIEKQIKGMELINEE